jgi:ketosteroid isomerase-like protein
MDRSAVQAWLDRYVDAWKSYDRADIEALFAPDATYTYHPYDTGDDVVRGRDAIVQNWLDNRDDAGTYDAQYEPYAIDGDRAVAVGQSRYYSDASKSTRTQAFDNCYLLRFDGEGRCVAFTEYFMKVPDAK